jgi:CDP-paratose 2-epimerase
LDDALAPADWRQGRPSDSMPLPSSASDVTPAERRILVTGGAGFIGANLAVGMAMRHPGWQVLALDNLHRRGSELNLTRLREAGVAFHHGDVRNLRDLLAIGEIDALVECSAEPSVLAGFDESPDYVVQTNLLGAYNCLELARRASAQMVFLSTSRVYPVAGLERLAVLERDTRLQLSEEQSQEGASARGITERFPLEGARTLYGSTKLSAELLIGEYAETYGLQTAINRCGVVAGPWQMGKVDQGVFTYWMLAHFFQRPLSYIGFGGSGKQVRDLLHVEDLLDLIELQLCEPARWSGATVNVGGGTDCSLSLMETTALCREITGNDLEIGAAGESRPGDVPIYISDCARLYKMTDWRPRRGPAEILEDIHAWIVEHENQIAAAL